MSTKEEKRGLLCGVIANVIFMAGDWLMDVFGPGNVEVGLAAETGYANVAMWRLVASILCGAVGICFYIFGANAFVQRSKSICRMENKHSVRMHKCFRAGIYIGMVSAFCIHTLCVLIGVIYKYALAAGLSAEMAAELTNNTAMTFIVPFAVFYIVMDFGSSIPFIYMVLKGELKVKKIAVLCCPLAMLILPLPILKPLNNYILNDIFCARESFGWLLMFLTAYLSLRSADGGVQQKDAE